MVLQGATVRAVMTAAACRFITPCTLQSITGHSVYTDLFSDSYSHLNLSRAADILIIAPATANTIGKIACGIADNLISTIFLAFNGPVIIAPAMNTMMYDNHIVRGNIDKLKKSGITFVGPVEGDLACGNEGMGRLSEVFDIVDAVIGSVTEKDLAGKKILVTAGPTREYIDPVRFISNRSSGRMGFEIARAAVRRGASVTLISGPSAIRPPNGASFVPVESASDMKKAVFKSLPQSEALIMAAAVSDFGPAVRRSTKVEKSAIGKLRLGITEDILKEAKELKLRCILVGFAAETGKKVDRARKKLREKKLDMIVLNDVSQEGSGFDVDTNIVTIIDSMERAVDYPRLMKSDVAHLILDRIQLLLQTGQH